MLSKLIIALGLICLVGSVSYAGEDDIFHSIPTDKVSHFGIGVAGTLIMQQGWGWKPAQACAGIMVIATAKEYYDSQTGGYWDTWDWVATMSGWAFTNSINVRYTW